MINRINVIKATRLVGATHTRHIVRFAQEQDAIEILWTTKVKALNAEVVENLVDSYRTGSKPDLPLDIFMKFLIDHYFDVAELAVESTRQEMTVIAPRLAARPPIPKSLKDLRVLWDTYRKTGRAPKGFRDRAEEIKAQYLKKTKDVWRKHSEDFRDGDAATQENVLRKIQSAADTVESRAKTVVRTETTNYYNETRREIYDQADAVWGYLFLAIRDQGTTKWCTDKVRQGKRGRHGLVYKKGDPLTAKETPSCHWQCRSEFVPLTMFNPRHRKLIEDMSKRRRNHVCHPLPPGWS